MTTVIKIDNGKYAVTHENGANLQALRHNQPWRDLTGDGLVLAMAQEIELLREQQSLLLNSITRVAETLGIIDRAPGSATGPQCLMLLDDVAKMAGQYTTPGDSCAENRPKV